MVKMEPETEPSPAAPVVVDCRPPMVKTEVGTEFGPAEPIVICNISNEQIAPKVENDAELDPAEPVVSHSSTEPKDAMGESIVAEVDASMVEVLGLAQSRFKVEPKNCSMRQENDAQVDRGVQIEGVAAFETHDTGNCRECNHTAPGMGDADASVAQGACADLEAHCNHTSPGTGGNYDSTHTNPNTPEWIIPDALPSKRGECNQISPGTPGSTTSIESTMSLGSRIDPFSKSQTT